MTQNPFGEGGFDLGAMLEQAQQMQAQLVAAQEELASTTVEGTAGGVGVTLTGTGELSAVSIPTGVVDGSDAESLADLQDLLVAAYRDAKAKADALTSQVMGPLAGGLSGGLPGAGGAGGSSFGFGAGELGGPGV